MALYAFDGTGDRWDPPGFRWGRLDFHTMDPTKKEEVLASIDPEVRNKKSRLLTNVVFFLKEYVQSGLHAEYFPGVGSGAWFETKTGQTLDFIFGGAFGIGAQGIVGSALKRLKRNVERGDQTIDIVGYSRGAAIACMFAEATCRKFRKVGLSSPPPIRFLGLMDTVASFGNPFNNNEVNFQPTLPFTVRQAVHAMAYDLNRRAFGLDRVFGNHVLEVWFRGGHGDIGGNAQVGINKPNRSRTNIVLNFLLNKAVASGVELTATTYPIDLDAPLSVYDNNRLNRPGQQRDPSRQLRADDILHHSFFADETPRQLVDGWSGRQVEWSPPLGNRDSYVIEEASNETELAHRRILQLTPELARVFPSTQAIYTALHETATTLGSTSG
jgi:hypothetical protein